MNRQHANQGPRGVAVLGYAVTPLHPGVGRSPGAVDLPVQRDPMGYPMIYASSVKGAFKAECARRLNCFNGSGRVDCDRDGDNNSPGCSCCCCFFGREPGSQKDGSAILDVLDFIPLFIPVPSYDKGYIYITTPYLASKALSILEAIDADNSLNSLKELLHAIAEASLGSGEAATCSAGNGSETGSVYITTTKLNVERNAIQCTNDSMKGLSKVQELGGLAQSIDSRLFVVSDIDGPILAERGMVRLTRVRLRLDTKTVSTGGLWTEEYIPAGTIFLGGFVAVLPRRNEYCSTCCAGVDGIEDGLIIDISAIINKFYDIYGSKAVYAVVGGKETVGKGLLKLITLNTVTG